MPQQHKSPLTVWQRAVKRVIDVVVSAVALLLLFPLFLFIAIRVRLSSPGPVFFLQERIGFEQKPFCIIKFRSMYSNAEAGGPALSHTNDARITPWGRTMRKWRLDELPQLWNVLRGDMSLVGPRAERQFYIDQLLPLLPEFSSFFAVKPGLTSLGMVRFGYAQNVAEMIERARYDLAYMQNISLLLDFKIMLQTLRIIFRGKGK